MISNDVYYSFKETFDAAVEDVMVRVHPLAVKFYEEAVDIDRDIWILGDIAMSSVKRNRDSALAFFDSLANSSYQPHAEALARALMTYGVFHVIGAEKALEYSRKLQKTAEPEIFSYFLSKNFPVLMEYYAEEDRTLEQKSATPVIDFLDGLSAKDRMLAIESCYELYIEQLQMMGRSYSLAANRFRIHTVDKYKEWVHQLPHDDYREMLSHARLESYTDDRRYGSSTEEVRIDRQILTKLELSRIGVGYVEYNQLPEEPSYQI